MEYTNSSICTISISNYVSDVLYIPIEARVKNI